MNSAEKASLIRLKVAALLKRVTDLEKAIKLADLEKAKLEQIILNQTKSIEILEDKNKISKLAEGIHLGKQDITEVKYAINRYIREIDECLKLLNQFPNNN